MAWYYGTYTCGHEGRTNVVGPSKSREWKVERHFDDLCPDCKEAKRMEENEKSIETAKEMELPELIGSEKQVAWANTIRVKAVEQLDIEIESEDNESKKKQLSDASQYIMQNKTKASWWIDTRTYGARNLAKEGLKEMKELEETETPASVTAETTLIPEDQVKDGIAKITVTDKSVQAEYVKDEDFIEIVKSLGYKWERPWAKHITLTSGAAADRAAELGNRLLNAGFSVQLQDPDIRNKAINADYEPECKRWVVHNVPNNKLSIQWLDGRNSRLYESAKKIKSAKWDGKSGSVLVSVEYFSEVEDFAEMFGFKFSPGAVEAIKHYKDELSTIDPVHTEASVEVEDVDKLEEILQSSKDVISDLIDDEA